MSLPDVKEVAKRVRFYIHEYGLGDAHERIKKDYHFYPDLRRTMLFILYTDYGFYKFRNKEKLY